MHTRTARGPSRCAGPGSTSLRSTPATTATPTCSASPWTAQPASNPALTTQPHTATVPGRTRISGTRYHVVHGTWRGIEADDPDAPRRDRVLRARATAQEGVVRLRTGPRARRG